MLVLTFLEGVLKLMLIMQQTSCLELDMSLWMLAVKFTSCPSYKLKVTSAPLKQSALICLKPFEK